MATTDFRIERLEARRTAVVRRSAARPDLSAAFGESFGRVFSTLAANGIAPASMPLVRYLQMEGDTLEFEAGAVVEAEFAGSSGVQSSETPGGEVASATYFGAYDGLFEAHAKLVEWIAEQGRETSGPPWEEYLNDPGENPDPATWQTRMSYPLK